MENGEEKIADLELTPTEAKFVRDLHSHHLDCDIQHCPIHAVVHLVVRLEAARRRLEHDLLATEEGEMGTHGVDGLCERCKWTSIDWVTSLASDWGVKE